MKLEIELWRVDPEIEKNITEIVHQALRDELDFDDVGQISVEKMNE